MGAIRTALGAASALLVLCASASAGVLSAEPVECFGTGAERGCPDLHRITYRAGHDARSHIYVRSLAGGGLALTDTKNRIRPVGEASRVCSLTSPHAALCPSAVEPSVYGGNHGDFLDTRAFRERATLTGGRGHDVILAGPGSTAVKPGPGDNVVVGNKMTTVNYADVEGPLTVDLARGIARAPGKNDRLIGIRDVLGSIEFPNRLLGSTVSGASFLGGHNSNEIVIGTEGIATVSDIRHEPSTVRCDGHGGRVEHEEEEDTLLGTCRVEQLQLLGGLRSLSSPFLRVEHGGIYEYDESRVDRVDVVALASHAPVCTIIEPESGAYPSALCSLNAVGQRLLRKDRRLRVQITELVRQHPRGEPLTAPSVAHTFGTVLVRAG